jgi:hypothetical protein
MFASLKRASAKKAITERTKLRIGVAIVGVAFSASLILAAFNQPPESHVGSLLMHMAAVFAEVALTFAVVDTLFERNREREAARQLAVRTLNRIHHHVWVWQGSNRDLSLPQIVGTLKAVTSEPSDQNPLPDFTQTLFLRLGSDAANSLRNEPQIIERNEHLHRAFDRLVRLAALRDESVEITPAEVAEITRGAAIDLAIALGTQLPIIGIPSVGNSSVDAQRWRHFGARRNHDAA